MRTSCFDLYDGVDLDGGVEGKCRHADGGAGVFSGFAENVGDEVGGAVDHQVLLGEVGRGGDEAVELEDTADAAEVAAKSRLRLCEDVDGAKLGRALGTGDIDIAADEARHRNFAVFD